MPRSLFITVIVLCTALSSLEQTTQTPKPFALNYNPPDINKLIVRNDTSLKPGDFSELIISSFDQQNRLLKKATLNRDKSNDATFDAYMSIYDTDGNTIYEETRTNGIRWRCYKYQYDQLGRLILKQGFNSGKMEINIVYSYKDGKETKEITERPLNSKALQAEIPGETTIPIKYQVIHRDTITTHYVTGERGKPGYKNLDSTEIWGDIILPNYPQFPDSLELDSLVRNIMKENNLAYVMVFRDEHASMLARLNSLYAYNLLKKSKGLLGRFKE